MDFSRGHRLDFLGAAASETSLGTLIDRVGLTIDGGAHLHDPLIHNSFPCSSAAPRRMNNSFILSA